jgi:hypothetical protein
MLAGEPDYAENLPGGNNTSGVLPISPYDNDVHEIVLSPAEMYKLSDLKEMSRTDSVRVHECVSIIMKNPTPGGHMDKSPINTHFTVSPAPANVDLIYLSPEFSKTFSIHSAKSVFEAIPHKLTKGFDCAQQQDGHLPCAAQQCQIEAEAPPGPRPLEVREAEVKKEQIESPAPPPVKIPQYVSIGEIRDFFQKRGITTEDVIDNIFRDLKKKVMDEAEWKSRLFSFLGENPQLPEHFLPGLADRVFALCDTDADKSIDVNDLAKGIKLFCNRRVEQTHVEKVFDNIDLGGKKYFTEQDLQRFLTKVGEWNSKQVPPLESNYIFTAKE